MRPDRPRLHCGQSRTRSTPTDPPADRFYTAALDFPRKGRSSMDTMPPQAPPALTQSAYQAATDAFDRLVALQVLAGHPGPPASCRPCPIPSPPAPSAAYLTALDAYWDCPAPGRRRGRLAPRHARLTPRHRRPRPGPPGSARRHPRRRRPGPGPRPRSDRHRQPCPPTSPSANRWSAPPSTPASCSSRTGATPSRVLVFSTQRGWESPSPPRRRPGQPWNNAPAAPCAADPRPARHRPPAPGLTSGPTPSSPPAPSPRQPFDDPRRRA